MSPEKMISRSLPPAGGKLCEAFDKLKTAKHDCASLFLLALNLVLLLCALRAVRLRRIQLPAQRTRQHPAGVLALFDRWVLPRDLRRQLYPPKARGGAQSAKQEHKI